MRHDVRSWAESRNCRTSSRPPAGVDPSHACRCCRRGCRLHGRRHPHCAQAHGKHPAALQGGRRRHLPSLPSPRRLHSVRRGPEVHEGPGAGCGLGHRRDRRAPPRAVRACRRASAASRRRRRGEPRGACVQTPGPPARARPAAGGGLCGAKKAPRAPLPPGARRPEAARQEVGRGARQRHQAPRGAGRPQGRGKARSAAQRAAPSWGRERAMAAERRAPSANRLPAHQVSLETRPLRTGAGPLPRAHPPLAVR